ncbi:MAG: alkaline phosphatase, partial [Gammaproteobacteria bacterium]|nr:alkaline phosphatase [Gammaproteobacteria bacterium]
MARNVSRRDLLKGIVPAGTALTIAPGLLKASSTGAFYHGIASGDPTQYSVIIWTRVTSSQRQLKVSWEVSGNRNFTSIIARGEVEATAASDYTVKVDVAALQPATDYYYRFTTMGAQSDVGRTRTLPVGEVSSFKMAVCSCSNYPAGYFNAYAAMAEQPDIDVVVHLGDYIYEYDAAGYASADAETLGRISEPLHEATRLADYRRRHAQYKTDKNLQKLHSRVAFILSWDDHEIANDAWQAGADNHDAGEGDWRDRKAAALQAYYEWMSIREPAAGDNT